MQLVRSTSDLLKTISAHIDQIKTVVSDIATTATSQAKHLDGFKTTIHEIDVSTQQTAAMAEESKAACHSMESEAALLLQLISQFDLGEETSSGTHEASQSPSPKNIVAISRMRGMKSPKPADHARAEPSK
ncbi:hypothetical protein [Rhizobium mongolense]|uniref:Methyl-accepting chemotaxis protein n=1 Tax=Rhizobium mongolense TaxID=57676 RepID=A0ABR6IZE9_9HYPH|nr:hypothetical protein [Rhizobium mongolense]MBB4233301.1 methyl-accepting chemotaxis protein [Rhizobium mongolense]